MQNPKIPLNERLKLAKSGATPFLSAYELTAADISSEIHKVTGNSLLTEHYRDIQKYTYDNDTNILYFLSQFLYTHTAAAVFLEESLKLKYYGLIEPFAILYEYELEQQREKYGRRKATATENGKENDQ